MQRLLLLLTLFVSASSLTQAQLASVPVDSEKDPYVQSYNFETEQAGIYTISIVNPNGEIQTVLLVEEELNSPDAVDFSFNTKWWKKGTYTILIENDKGYLFTKDIKIEPSY